MLRRICCAVAFALAVIAIANAQPPRQQAKVVGKWKMTWTGSTADAEFLANGSYWCDWVDGRRWEGTWTYDVLTDTVHVAEGPGGIILVAWEAKLETGSLKGQLACGGTFELKP